MAAADAGAVTDCHVRCWYEAHGHELPAHLRDALGAGRSASRWRRVAGDPAIDTRIATPIVPGPPPVLGFASVGPARDDAAPTALELHALYIRAAWYGTGLADALLAAVLPPHAACVLWVLESNARARGFYRRHGFAADGARGVDPFALLPTLRMTRPLPSPGGAPRG